MLARKGGIDPPQPTVACARTKQPISRQLSPVVGSSAVAPTWHHVCGHLPACGLWRGQRTWGAAVIEGTPGEPLKGDKSAIGPEPGTPQSGYRFGPGTLQPGRGDNAAASNTPWLRAVTADDAPTATPRGNPAAIRCGSCRQAFPVQRADPVGTGPDAVNGGTKARGVDAEGGHRMVVTCPHCGKKNRIPQGAGATAATIGAPGERNSRVIPQDGKTRAAKEHDRRRGASGDPVPQSRTAAERSVDHNAGSPYVSDWPPVSYGGF